MTAIITQNFRFSQLQNFRDQLGSSPYIYLGIGKPSSWDDADGLNASEVYPPIPSSDDGKDFPDLMSVKRIEKEKTAYVIPRINWRRGDLYDYSGKQGASKFYVLTSEYKLYKCIDVPYIGGVQQPSINEPTSTSTNIFETSDGYRWKYLLTIPTSDAIEFLTNDWIPIRKMDLITDSGAIDQWSVQQAAVPGTVEKYVINNGGTGFTSTPTLEVKGNGVGASITPIMSAGSIVGITINSVGTGYTYVTVKVVGGGGSGASISGVISPVKGHGASVVDELNSTNLMINMVLSFAEGSGDFPIRNNYRKIFLLTDLTLASNNSAASDITYSAMEKIVMQSVAYTPQALTINSDDTVTGETSSATGLVAQYDYDTKTIEFVFREGEFISSRLNSFTISTAGTGYSVGQLLSFTSSIGVGAKAYISAVNGTGGVTGLNFDTGSNASRGRNYQINDIITATGGSPTVACQITVNSIQTENVKIYRGGIDTGILGSNIAYTPGEINKTGNIIYKDYRTAIDRDINQRENIVIVLGF